MLKIIKKNGLLEDYDEYKIKNAITKSASRVMVELSEEQKELVCHEVLKSIGNKNIVNIVEMHLFVENALDKIDVRVAKSYRDYRNYKQNFAKILQNVMDTVNILKDEADHNNANADSELVTTKRTLIYKSLSKELYRNFFLNQEEVKAIDEGYIYIHDLGDRSTTMNCCLFDMGKVMCNGFDMENMHYN